ncbi:MAG: AMP-binding protein [Candidatus Tectimicrobiota bacterium]
MHSDRLSRPSREVLWQHWEEQAHKAPEREAVIHWVAGQEPYRWHWGPLVDKALHVAFRLQEAGVTQGDVCALILRHHKDFYPIYMGVCALGALPAVLAYPNARLHPDKFQQGIQGMARHSGLDWILTENSLESLLRPLIYGNYSTIKGLLFPTIWSEESCSALSFLRRPQILSESPCLLQHSSGTTGLQKAVVLSHRAILDHVQHYGTAIGLQANDKVVSWLPLYHDMGLIAAFYLPLTHGIPVVCVDPFEWVMAPILLLEALSLEHGTLTWMPNFAYNLMADRIHEEDLSAIRLDRVRMFINCSEPVRAESHEKFLHRFAPYGLKREALGACYAMAETTFAVTQTPAGHEATTLFVDREKLAQGTVHLTHEHDRARSCVSSGLPITGCRVRIIDPAGLDLPDDCVGEIAIQSVSLFNGYHNNPERTFEVLRDSWYFSGDYGFRHEGQYYIIGRKKDIIIVAGKNIYPEDIEDIVSQVAGVLPGRVVAFGLEDQRAGTEQICVIAETNVESDTQKKQLQLAIREAGMHIDLTIARVYLVAPRWLIKSSAGKPSRQANRERALASFSQY